MRATSSATSEAPSPAGRRGWRQRLRAGMAAAIPRRWFLVQGPARGDAACLTFDDGPDPEHTPRLLDVLGELRVPATFFVIGEKAEKHPELVRRIAAEGHTIGHHTYSHSDPDRTSTRQLVEELRRTSDVLGGLTGVRPNLFRPPYGKMTAAKFWGAWRNGQTVVLWNVDPKDFSRTSPDEVGAWFARRPLRGGDVVLMHDNVPHAARVLPELVRGARERGISFADIRRWAR